MNGDGFQLVVNTFAAAFPDRLNLLLLDTSGAPPAQRLTLPENVRLVCLPPFCPELNPIEGNWRARKDAMTWRQFAHLEAQQAHLATLLRAYQAATLRALTGYPYLVEAIHARCP